MNVLGELEFPCGLMLSHSIVSIKLGYLFVALPAEITEKPEDVVVTDGQ